MNEWMNEWMDEWMSGRLNEEDREAQNANINERFVDEKFTTLWKDEGMHIEQLLIFKFFRVLKEASWSALSWSSYNEKT